MRLAWFRPATHVADRLDDTAALVRALESEHEIHVVDETRAHDFIRLDFRAPFDVCVFELADTSAHAYIWPYLLHIPGVLRLRSLSLHESRSASLRRQRREQDRTLELAFSDWDLLGAPVLASRLTVVSDTHAAARLQRAYPAARVRHAPVGVRGLTPRTWGLTPTTRGQTPVVGAATRMGVVQTALARARDAGAHLELLADVSPDRILDEADVIIAMTWPPANEQTLALAGMAAGKAVVVFETEHTAGWPALDPQTWQARGWTGERPIVVSVDPRDEEHSLSLALRRLAHEATLRHALGAAAHDWWQQHGTVDHAVRAWRSILEEASAAAPAPRPRNWPAHLTADGTARAREILGEFSAAVDFMT
jgi:hypothetical protein